MPGVVLKTFSPRIWEAEVGDQCELEASLVYMEAPGQPRLHSETVWKQNKKFKACVCIWEQVVGLILSFHPVGSEDQIQIQAWQQAIYPWSHLAVAAGFLLECLCSLTSNSWFSTSVSWLLRLQVCATLSSKSSLKSYWQHFKLVSPDSVHHM